MAAAQPDAGAGQQPAIALFTRAVDDTATVHVIFQGNVLEEGTVARSWRLSEFLEAGAVNAVLEVAATDAQITRWIHHTPDERAENIPGEMLWDLLNVRALASCCLV